MNSLKDIKNFVCPECGNDLFDTKVEIKLIPGTLVGRAGETIPTCVDVYLCSKCGKRFSEEDFKSAATAETPKKPLLEI